MRCSFVMARRTATRRSSTTPASRSPAASGVAPNFGDPRSSAAALAGSASSPPRKFEFPIPLPTPGGHAGASDLSSRRPKTPSRRAPARSRARTGPSLSRAGSLAPRQGAFSPHPAILRRRPRTRLSALEHLVARERFCEVIALGEIAAQLPELLELLDGLYTFCPGLKPECVGKEIMASTIVVSLGSS